MIDISAISTNLARNEEGIWVARNQRDISYPEDGNQTCFELEDSSYWFRHRNDVITHLVKKSSPNVTFFDIGGGNGCVSYALQRQGHDVVLLEPGQSGVRNAKQRGLNTVIQSTLEDAGFAHGSVPSAGIFDVLEHIEQDIGFLEMLHRYLQPQGYLYITVPAFDFLWSAEDTHAGHFRRYTISSLTTVLKKAGFDTEYCSYLFAFLVPPIFAVRSLPSRLGIRKTVKAATTQKEHSAGGGLSAAIVDQCLAFELNRIKRGKCIPIGSSCIAVARKSS
jgi:SAM-dependent methyltransferase